KLFGAEPERLETAARAIDAAIRKVPGVVDAFDGIDPIGATVRFDVDELRARAVGMEAQSVQHWVETAVTGTVVGQVLERERAIPIRVRYPDEFRDDLAKLADLTLVAPDGRLAPLRSVAT